MDIVGDSLKKITKGAAVYFTGTILGLLIAFVSRIIVIRYISPAEFGLLSLSLTIFTMVSIFTSLGLPNGLTRQASYFIGKNEYEKTVAIFKAGLVLAIISSLIADVGLFALSNSLSKFFKMPDLSWILKILLLALPMVIVSKIILSIFQVYEKVNIKVIFNDLMPNTLRILLVVVVVILSLSFYWIVVAYSLAFIISGIIFLIYFFREVSLETSENIYKYIKILILFSLPLLFQSTLGMIMNWTDTLMIGYFLTPSDVGLYSGVLPLAKLMINFLVAMNFIYFPLISQLYAKNQINEMGKIYAIITKWLMSASLPIFLVLFFFPNAVLRLLYGNAYVPAAYALQVLALGFFTHITFGPNGMTLIATGDVRYLTVASSIASIVNFVLNLILIPLFGINGAAIASALTYVTVNILISLKLYKNYGIHPFTRNYIKPAITSSVAATLIYLISRITHLYVSCLALVLLFVLFLAIYFLSLLLTRSFDKEDMMMLLAIEQRLGIDLSRVRKILKRFI